VAVATVAMATAVTIGGRKRGQTRPTGGNFDGFWRNRTQRRTLWRSAAFSNGQATFEWRAIGNRLGNEVQNEKGTEPFGRARSLSQE
jgi:hypothetical protein